MPYDPLTDGQVTRSEIVGLDGTGNYRVAQVDSSGALKTIVTVEGTVQSTVAQGLPNSLANAWPVQLTNGTTQVGVDAGSTGLHIFSTRLDANLSTLLTTAAFQARVPVLGQGLMAASIPVVIASNQTSISVTATNTVFAATQSGVWNIGTVTTVDTLTSITNPVAITAASLPLPTGAATEATLSTLNGKIPANLTVTSTRLL